MTEERHRLPLVAQAGTPGGGFWLTVPQGSLSRAGRWSAPAPGRGPG